MSVSGIYVVVAPSHWQPALAALGGLPGVDLHQRDPSHGRLVVTQEADSLASHMAGLSAMQQVPGVCLAELVYHYCDDGPASTAAPPAEQGAHHA